MPKWQMCAVFTLSLALSWLTAATAGVRPVRANDWGLVCDQFTGCKGSNGCSDGVWERDGCKLLCAGTAQWITCSKESEAD